MVPLRIYHEGTEQGYWKHCQHVILALMPVSLGPVWPIGLHVEIMSNLYCIIKVKGTSYSHFIGLPGLLPINDT